MEKRKKEKKNNQPTKIKLQNPPKSYHTCRTTITQTHEINPDSHLSKNRTMNQPRPMKSRTRTIHHYPRNRLGPQRKINNQRKRGRVRKKEKEETQTEMERRREREREKRKK